MGSRALCSGTGVDPGICLRRRFYFDVNSYRHRYPDRDSNIDTDRHGNNNGDTYRHCYGYGDRDADSNRYGDREHS